MAEDFLCKRMGRTRPARAGTVTIMLLLCSFPSMAKSWDKHYIEALPDSAFASIEVDKTGLKHRHLPHHDASGAVDSAHLRAALARWKQVHWIDPNDAQPALEHLKTHFVRIEPDKQTPRYAGPHESRR